MKRMLQPGAVKGGRRDRLWSSLVMGCCGLRETRNIFLVKRDGFSVKSPFLFAFFDFTKRCGQIVKKGTQVKHRVAESLTESLSAFVRAQ
jgi:hypothetical protein